MLAQLYLQIQPYICQDYRQGVLLKGRLLDELLLLYLLIL